ncbi:BQ5605_C009g05682 [Microbotryum silenes-dioicae]|uniref:BQ5605_C009g05682 protein n=1 Tax=Microbotryum silenes-dioicae TaxID=796604 RepID=A0A2X0MIF8_9BASI|nr:BQ5605_C009g05682 [Microbotryum silenes-dioicae]
MPKTMRSPDAHAHRGNDDHSDSDYEHPSPSSTPTTAIATPAQSGIHLAPNLNISYEHMLEGEVLNVLADRVLALHARLPTSNTSEPGHEGPGLASHDGTLHPGDHWFNRLTRSLSSNRGDADDDDDDPRTSTTTKLDSEREHLLGDGDLGDGDHFVQHEDVDDAEGSSSHHCMRKRPTLSRSNSTSRRLRWYQRPSPWFFIPGTLIMALSLGMTISPKLEIYYQLVCRNIEPKRSGVTLPPPLIELGQRTARSGLASSAKLDNNQSLVHRFVERAMGPQHFEFSSSATSGDSWSKQCHHSVPVQQGVTSLATTLTFLMGVLSALTTGYYGSLSDRRGRKPILVLAMFGTIVMDTVLLITVQYHHIVGYRFLFLGPIVDGLLGGATTAQATSNAYLADCTDAGSRARIFAVLGGVIFSGIAIGPTLGSILVRQSGSILLPFYIALTMHLLYTSVMMFIMPESLTKTRQYAARERHAAERATRYAAEDEEAHKAKVNGVTMVVLFKTKKIARRPWKFLKPLVLILPRKRQANEKDEDRPMLDAMGPVKAGWDFSMLKIVIAMSCFSIGMAVYQVKLREFLYTSYRFGWGAEENGLYLSFIGVCRVVGLIIVLPTFIRFVRRPAPLPPRARPEGELDTAGPTTLTKEQKLWDREASWLRTLHDSHFDLFLAKLSLLVDLVGYVLLALNGGSPVRFLIGTGFSAFGGGASAAVQSLALAHTSPRDSGRLFAGLSVLSSVNGMILGPLLFGTVFIATVEKMPETFLWVLVGLITTGLATLMTVRLRKRVDSLEELLDAEGVTGP